MAKVADDTALVVDPDFRAMARTVVPALRVNGAEYSVELDEGVEPSIV